jgi:hypothetical protein
MRWVCLASLLLFGCKDNKNKMGPQELPDGFTSNACTLDSECDDGDPCTTDTCGTDMQCSSTAKDCSMVLDDCNAASCDAMTGNCVGVPKREGRTCTDQATFTMGTCMMGVCTPLPQCAQSANAFLDCGFQPTAMDDTSMYTGMFTKYTCPNSDNLTGPEVGIPLFVSNDGLVTLTLDATDPTVDLDLLVLEDTICSDQSPCAASSTQVGTGHESVTFNASAAKSYTVVVDGRNGAQGPFTLTMACNTCKPVQTLDCNMSVTGDTTDTSKSTMSVNDWICAPALTNGPEITYQLKPPVATDYTFKLTGLTQDLDLIVTDENAGTCSQSCATGFTGNSIKSGTANETATFSATGGKIYDVVVDSKNAGSGYMLEVDCAPSCIGADVAFACSDGSVSGRNDDSMKSTNRVDSWQCDADTTGREVAYHFSAPATGDYDFYLIGLTADLDLIAIKGTATSCDPAATCVAGDNPGTSSEHVQIHAMAGDDWYIVVDGKNGAVSPYTLRIQSAACPAYFCTPPASQSLSCTNKEDRSTSDGAKSKDVVDAWTCAANTTGAEVVYQFKPTTTATYTVELDELTADLQLLEVSGTCKPSPAPANCVAGSPAPSPSPSPTPGPYVVTFPATAGQTYNLIVDGKNGAAGNYHISIVSGCN